MNGLAMKIPALLTSVSLIEPVGAHREGMQAVGRAPEAPGLTSLEPVLPHQPRQASSPRLQTLLAQLVRHARAAIGLVRAREGRTDMGEQDQVLALAARGGGGLSRGGGARGGHRGPSPT